MSFYSEKLVRSVRKARRCMGCCRTIEVGSSALECAGVWEGDFWSGTYHTDCRAAELALNKLHDLYADEWMSLDDMERDDWPWLIEVFPAVAERKGITTERFNEAEAEQQRRRDAFRKARP